MAIVDYPAFRIYDDQRLYDDERPLNKNTPNFDFPRSVDDPAPYIVVVQGPRSVGKSLLIQSLVKKFTENHLIDDQGLVTTLPVTTSSGKEIRLQLVECPNDINGMIDAAKYADVAILMVDASYEFEMETFEFRNLLQVHGFPKVIGVLTHLDKVDQDKKPVIKMLLEYQFRANIYEDAQLSSLSGLKDGFYSMPEIGDLGEKLLDSQFLPSSWRSEHPYVLVDRSLVSHEDNRLYLRGYLRGCDIIYHVKLGAKVHIVGAGDFSLAGVTKENDPCPLKSSEDSKDSELDYYRTGTYINIILHNVPSETLEHLVHQRHPVLVRILPEEELKSGFMMVKLRRQSWYMSLLMSGVPVIVSAGLRRYQTNVIYAMENENGLHQLLTMTPEHKDCLAVIWGPLSPPKTRIAVVPNKFYCTRTTNQKAFQILAKGVVLEFNYKAEILLEVKKTELFRKGRNKKDKVLFPVLAILVLPPLFKQLGGSATTEDFGGVDTAVEDVDAAIAEAVHTITTTIEDELPFSYKELLPEEVTQEMHDLRRGVVIDMQRGGCATLPNVLELIYASKQKQNKKSKKRKRCLKGAQKSGEVKEKHRIDQKPEEGRENILDLFFFLFVFFWVFDHGLFLFMQFL
ncbi:hypothetical protein MKW94_012460 [Papaver nudicaule]|uniref:Uncharacterized protein n=1 Tax=Papaver nudicaule TaxID=74823 RepID=A0AA41S140_PAPNU|nr:hypothetical protein [Papaver nudicaule]